MSTNCEASSYNFLGYTFTSSLLGPNIFLNTLSEPQINVFISGGIITSSTPAQHNRQCSKWKFRTVGIIVKSEIKDIPSDKWKKIDKWIQYVLMSTGMKFRNRKKFQYDIPAYTGPFRALIIGEIK
jgi:hypothetical protein